MAAAAAMLVMLLTFAAAGQDADSGDDAVAIFNDAQDLHEHGDLAGAIKLYDKALSTMPEFPEAAYQRGVAELELGQRDEAETSFRRALELRSDWALASTSLGSLLIDKGQYDEAERLLTSALAAESQNAPALIALIDLRLKTKASQKVLLDLLDKVSALTAKASPTAAMWSSRGALEFALDQRETARTSVENALRLDAKNRPALFLAANIALKDGDIVRAQDTANALEKLGADKQALAALKANIAAADAGTNANTADLEKQLEADPKNVTLLGTLCTSLRRSDPRKAASYCRRASEAEPTNVSYAVGYAAALVQAKDFEPAVVVLKKLVTTTPDNSTAHANLATALFELKRYGEASEQYEWLVAKQPELAAAYYFLAVCYDRLGRTLDAMANYQQYVHFADPAANKLDIEKVNLRLGQLQKKKK